MAEGGVKCGTFSHGKPQKSSEVTLPWKTVLEQEKLAAVDRKGVAIKQK